MVLKELYVKLGLSVDGSQFFKAQALMEGLKLGVHALAAAYNKTIGAFIKIAQESAEASFQLERMSAKTGISVERLQDLQRMAEVAGTSTDKFIRGLVLLARTMGASQGESNKTAQEFKKFGIQIEDANTKKLRPLGDMFWDIFNVLSKMEDKTKRTQLAIKWFGRGGAEILPILELDREQLDQISRLMPVLGGAQVRSGAEIIRTQKLIALANTALWRSATAEMFPALEELIKKYAKWKIAMMPILKTKLEDLVIMPLVRGFRWLSKAIQESITGTNHIVWVIKGALIGALFLLTPKIIALSWAMMNLAMTTLAAAAPYLALAAAILAVGFAYDDFKTWMEGGESLIGDFMKWMDKMMSSTKPGEEPWWLAWLHEFRYLLLELKNSTLIQDVIDAITGEFLGEGALRERKLRRAYQRGKAKRAEIGTGPPTKEQAPPEGAGEEARAERMGFYGEGMEVGGVGRETLERPGLAGDIWGKRDLLTNPAWAMKEYSWEVLRRIPKAIELGYEGYRRIERFAKEGVAEWGEKAGKGRVGFEIDPTLPRSMQPEYNVSMPVSIPITINPAPGMDEERLGEIVAEKTGAIFEERFYGKLEEAHVLPARSR